MTLGYVRVAQNFLKKKKVKAQNKDDRLRKTNKNSKVK